ncbi:hypothetical protein HPY18_03880 [Vibrio parahaemolyticus]|uniref:hypothetical protein n=1 Tax=Vibrio parahaemolyticus TaxID=670 RepID=UPI001688BA21|nr:hypothetical protein [Vibrio parahaemolyticus]MBD2853563.1 hypothetical protein [Vibrio parahaemolyticus]
MVDLFFGAVSYGLTKLYFFAEILPVEIAGTSADLLDELTFFLVWKVHVASVTFLKVLIVRLVFQNGLLELLVRFLWCCLFHVVSLSNCFETTPGLSASKHLKLIVYKV